jgi:drug/metabolite transporter (DMT)-like permease
VALAIALAVLAAALFALAAGYQQRAVREIGLDAPKPDPNTPAALLPVVTIVTKIARSRLWLIGWFVNLAGFLTQAIALHNGSVALVQPLLVTQLLFTLPIASMWGCCRPRRLDWLAALTICVGLAIFMASRSAPSTAAPPDRTRIVLAAVCALATILLLVLIAKALPPIQHAAVIAVGAGLCFALSAVFVKLTITSLTEDGVVATATDWPGYALAASTVAGLLLEQQAFSAGPLASAVAAMTITNPVASYVIAILGFHARFPSAGRLAMLSISAVVIATGVVALAHSPTVLGERAGPAGALVPSRAGRASTDARAGGYENQEEASDTTERTGSGASARSG